MLLAAIALFYMTDRPESIRSFLEHASQIEMIGPQMYSVDEQGLVWGALDPRVEETARKLGVKVMPLIVNPGFRQEPFHNLLANPEARGRMIANLLEECRRHKWYGIQFDFENVAYSDGPAFSSLFHDTASALGREGFKLSLATVHRFSDYPGKGDFAHWLFRNWRGSYDPAALAKDADFISVMAYDQHTRLTPPGPVAGMRWVREIVDYSLTKMPREKLSLGVALYGRRWYAGMRGENEAAMSVAGISGVEAPALAVQMGARVEYDPLEEAPWFHFYRDGIREYVFYNDARAFRARYELARAKGLHGISAWVLGAEDPGVWEVLKE